jgi:transposase
LIWDGAPYRRAQRVIASAQVLEIHLHPLPGYSPDFMPVEHLWQWLREDVTYHTCYTSKADLIEQVKSFEQQINAQPISLADRLWVKNHLNPEEEKLRFSS